MLFKVKVAVNLFCNNFVGKKKIFCGKHLTSTANVANVFPLLIRLVLKKDYINIYSTSVHIYPLILCDK